MIFSKNFSTRCIAGLTIALALVCSNANATSFSVGKWQLDFAETNGLINLKYDNSTVLKKSCAVVRIDSVDYSLINASSCTIMEAALSDEFGTGKHVSVTYTLDVQGKSVSVLHTYNLYENCDFILTRLTLSSDKVLSSNYLAPIYSTTSFSPLPDGDNRTLFVPFDNDGWVRYNSYNFGYSTISHEVGLLYNTSTLDGLVLGSIDHDHWKTGVTSNTSSNNVVTKLAVEAGHTDEWTRDVRAHGCVKGKTIQSPRILVGRFNDWRAGLETYADMNALVTPRREWKSGKPFIWNSWGVLQTDVNYMNASQNALFCADSLLPRGYQNDGTMYMDLDSYWDNLTSTQMKQFTRYCNTRGLKSGLYWTPFVDWAANPDRSVEGAAEYTYKDIWLYHNGEPIKRNGACACDPTHPATKKRAEHYFNNFHSWGYEFVKLDFMIHGILESDSWYDTTITTGVEAYNYGMHYIDSLAADMYVNLSIASLFPAQYANGRRIACDAYGSVTNAEYTLNSTTYGWWLDHIYTYNDGDLLVFHDQTVAVNRIRLLSGLITGIPCLGDDYSRYGDETAKERGKQLVNNPELMQMARETKAFRPLESASGTAATTQYYTKLQDTAFVALFNFSGNRTTYSFDLTEVGLQHGVKYTMHELMRGDVSEVADSVSVPMPRLDCYLMKIYPYTAPQGIEETSANHQSQTRKCFRDGQLLITRGDKTYNALGGRVE